MKNLSLILVLFSGLINAQAPEKFQVTYGGSGVDIGYSVKEINDREYVIVGLTSSFGAGATDAYLLVVDSMGNPIMQKTYGGAGNDAAKSVVFNQADKGFVFVGYSSSFGNGGYDAYLVRTDKNGDVIWQRSYGGADWDFANDLTFTADGNILFCGYVHNGLYGKRDAWVIKANIANGEVIWQKFFGGSQDDEFSALATNNGNDFVIAGQTKSYGDANGDVYLIKLDTKGDSTGTILYGGTDYDRANNLLVNMQGDVYVCGGSKSFTNGKTDALFVKFTSTGNVAWSKNFGYPGDDEEAFKIVPGTSPQVGETIAIYTTYEVPGYKKDIKTIYLTSGGDYFGGWHSGSHGFPGNDEMYDMIVTSDKGYAQVGYTESLNAIDKDIFFIKRDSVLNSGVLTVGIGETGKELIPGESVVFYPNPFNRNKESTIKLKNEFAKDIIVAELYSANGSKLGNLLPVNAQKSEFAFDSMPCAGLFYVKFVSTGKVVVSKLVILGED